jgi:hypothetical protein
MGRRNLRFFSKDTSPNASNAMSLGKIVVGSDFVCLKLFFFTGQLENALIASSMFVLVANFS